MRTIDPKFVILYLVLFLFLSIISVQAQQNPMYSQYMFNKLVFNPAVAGSNPKFICSTFLLHNEWAGLFGTGDEYTGVAPSTQTFSINAPIQNKNILSGYGIVATRNKLGYSYYNSVSLSMSIKRNFTFGTIQFGLNGGAIQKGFTKEYYGGLPPDHIIIPDFGAGIYIFNQNKYFLGLSTQHLIERQFKWGSYNSTDFLTRQTYIVAGYNYIFPSNPNIELQPSFLYRMEKAKKQFEINLNVLYKSTFWAGLIYKQGSSIAMLLGVKYKSFQLGYSYEIETISLIQNSLGTQEFLLNFCVPINTAKNNNVF